MTSGGPSLKSILREPLLHFAVVAAALVAAHQLYLRHSRPEVKLTTEWLDSMARDFELKSGRVPTLEERVKIAHAYVAEEILTREALKAGHTDDPRVRGMLATSLRETLEPVIADPSDAELQGYRERNPESFRYPAGVSFEHVSFGKAEEIPPGFLDALREGNPPAYVSSAMRMPNPMPMTWLPQIEKTFGVDFAAGLLTAKTGEWTGPLNSSRGLHFIKLIRRDEPREMSLEEVRPALVAKWQEERRKAVVSEKVAGMRGGYRIELPADIPPP
ncbi:peptidylprolyl isomerase [Haloferula sp. BvORR071]|uniref:peptidylprolyl isomerase n=1 Tax=Haloferula sp. BvORR071 TaxID=1396141 RepID=UPI00224101D3|nr:peptidylprolyl isomerase [Haloferula sp. BvORR071]